MYRPILFNTEMVKAILNGRKTVTRRCVKLPKYIKAEGEGLYTLFAEGTCYENQHFEQIIDYLKKPCEVGDILWVRETWSKNPNYKEYYFKTRNEQGIAPYELKWNPSIHMPKEAARIFLKVTEVRVERLKDIMDDKPGPNNQIVREGCKYGCDFIAAWESTISKSQRDTYGWDANPWVWVIEFERCEKPEDFN